MNSVNEMARNILDLTYQHSRNLAFFVTIYKSLLYTARKLRGYEHNLDALVAGAIGGYIIFGKDTSVNQQVSVCVDLECFE
jgi:peroxisomal membrane protein 4